MYTIHTHALTYSHMHTHTHYTPAEAVSGTCTSWALWCVHFPPLPSAGEHSVAGEGSPPLRQRAQGQTSVAEGGEWVKGGWSTLFWGN